MGDLVLGILLIALGFILGAVVFPTEKSIVQEQYVCYMQYQSAQTRADTLQLQVDGCNHPDSLYYVVLPSG